MTVPLGIAMLAVASSLAACSSPPGPDRSKTPEIRPSDDGREADRPVARPEVRPAPVQPPAEIDPAHEDPNNATSPG